MKLLTVSCQAEDEDCQETLRGTQAHEEGAVVQVDHLDNVRG